MQVFNNTLKVSRNESFTLDYELRNPDGSPYIISSQLAHPYMLITVANSRYSQNNRYVLNTWLDFKNELRFDSTNAISYADARATTVDAWGEYPYDEYGKDTTVYASIGVFYLDVNGKREYKYWKFTNESEDRSANDVAGAWMEYIAPRIIVPYSSETTATWNEQEYLYSIALVSGEPSGDTQKPIKQYDVVIPLLAPTPLSVQTNLKGVLL